MSTTRLHSAAHTAAALVLALAQRVALLVRFACNQMVPPPPPHGLPLASPLRHKRHT
jgi:hypothetical protein